MIIRPYLYWKGYWKVYLFLSMLSIKWSLTNVHVRDASDEIQSSVCVKMRQSKLMRHPHSWSAKQSEYLHPASCAEIYGLCFLPCNDQDVPYCQSTATESCRWRHEGLQEKIVSLTDTSVIRLAANAAEPHLQPDETKTAEVFWCLSAEVCKSAFSPSRAPLINVKLNLHYAAC